MNSLWVGNGQYGVMDAAASGERTAPLSSVTGCYFALRLFYVLIAVRIFGSTAQAGVTASLACNYALLGLALFALPTHRAQPHLGATRLSRIVCAYLLLTGVSLLWSVTASLAAATAFWGAMVADVAIVALQLRGNTPDVVARSLMGWFVRGASVIAVFAWLMPAQSDLRLGDEELLGPNQIGWLCGFGFFFAQYLLLRKQGGHWKVYAVLLGVTLLRCLSKTTIVAFLMAQLFILMRDREITRKTRRSLLALALLVGIAFSSLLASYYALYLNTGAGRQLESLTGRLGIWTYILSEAVHRPWLGHGFHSVWKVIPMFYGVFEARHAHNEALQQFYAYGVVGVILLFAIYISLFQEIRKLRVHSLKIFWLGFLLFVLVRGLADTEVFDISWPMWLILLFGALARQSNDGTETAS
ncbi:lipid A core-O-antigen ligase-like enyme [Terriglobus roseus DSM 18391]|uniref:Lipid A core-O-antigen ligase-like enyme n=1 Tax=Terriglobus roseus (strain DSM 18391 / NRRL B-41598 / KBS 63) TaxID=926566 RepID=I3ZE40_TERRK|nr:O-antigen ligase family protein [Terriglobus roseus]AFL87508.1 lipid A core-O-antigen ligase-like enyme [Terriglobus roseus DSM 18391]